MAIIHLYCAHYPDPPQDGNHVRFGDRPEEIDHPDWNQITTALARLDRDEWPYVWLYSEPPIEDEPPNNMLCVMGGKGLFAITLFKDGDEICFYDKTRLHSGNHSTTIWESDQGREVDEKFLCDSMNELCEIVYLFHTKGELAELVPGKRWKVC
ncbi:MAG: hypothetical protein U0930_13380 [Pirellulales bacterium]